MAAAYTVVLSPDPNGPWTAVCPAMPGAVTEADTRESALAAMADVMAGWLEIARRDGFQSLVETATLVADKIAEVLEDRAEEGWDLLVETALLSPRSVAAA